MDHDFKKIRRRLSQKKGLATYTLNEQKYLRKMLGKAAYVGKVGRPATRKKRDGTRKPSDTVTCKICNQKYRRSCKWNHERSMEHRYCARYHDDMYKILIGENEKKN